ncbi:MAG: hypothetical protein IJJ10_06450 [Bacillus sp. (in: Bacteria)]|nr:hypothetical protein [Bacillus sp. (in: firmicutes)]
MTLNLTKIETMLNLADSGQDQFVEYWAGMAYNALYEQGISHAYLDKDDATGIIAKATTDLIEDGNLSTTTLSLIATLRVNHPHSEDEDV